MSLNDHDITDDEIRIIKGAKENAGSAGTMNADIDDADMNMSPTTMKRSLSVETTPDRDVRRRNQLPAIITAAVAIVAAVFIGIILLTTDREDEGEEIDNIVNSEITDVAPARPDATAGEPDVVAEEVTLTAPVEHKGFVVISDTIVGGRRFDILCPRDARASLEIGTHSLNDTTAVMIFQAADTRRDNGGIVGAFVIDGELVSRGKAKAGFCAIIGEDITIGIAESTPLLEKATEEGGYFFRQFPLVVENQVIENKPKNRSLRKALAELNGKTVVILSRDKMTLNEFSQSLADMGVKNAIYPRVGSTAYGFARDADGKTREFGTVQPRPARNVNYIVWR